MHNLRDLRDDNYPWMLEWGEWQDGFAKTNKVVPGHQKGAPKAKLSNVLECVKAGKGTEEVWSRVVEQAGRPYIDPGLASDDDPEVMSLHETIAFVSRFAQWFRMKHEPNAHRHGYQGVYHALLAMALMPDDRVSDCEVRRALINEYVYDDTPGHEG